MSSGIYEFTQAKIKNSSGIIQFSFWTMNFMDEALIALPLYSLANPSVHASAPPPFRRKTRSAMEGALYVIEENLQVFEKNLREKNCKEAIFFT
ncbi:MAG: hypothetical protein J5817_06480 [Treponema sp.]|nr:hypothetical protein [Treponema sp.]